MMDENALDPRVLAEACLAYMSERDVEDMANDNDMLTDDVYDDDDDDDSEVEEVSFDDESAY